jgi:hypothetical protein
MRYSLFGGVSKLRFYAAKHLRRPRFQIFYVYPKVEIGNFQTSTCDLSIYINVHNIIVPITGDK